MHEVYRKLTPLWGPGAWDNKLVVQSYLSPFLTLLIYLIAGTLIKVMVNIPPCYNAFAWRAEQQGRFRVSEASHLHQCLIGFIVSSCRPAIKVHPESDGGVGNPK